MERRTELPLLPEACSLDAVDGTVRLGAWRGLLDRAGGSRRRVESELRIAFPAPMDADRAELDRLITAEQSCCPSLSWTLEPTTTGLELVVSGPATDLDRLAAL